MALFDSRSYDGRRSEQLFRNRFGALAIGKPPAEGGEIGHNWQQLSAYPKRVIVPHCIVKVVSRRARRIQLIVATRSLLAYRAHRRPTPRCLTVTLDEFISIAGYHRKHVIWRRCFRRCWWPNLDKHSAVLGLVQDEPALCAGAASGILDKTCARHSAGGRSAPRNGPA